MHRLFEIAPDIGGVHHGLGELGQRGDHGDDVDLLQAHLAHAAVALQVGALGLAGDEQAGRRVQPGACQPRDRVGSAGSRSQEGATQPARNLGVGLGGHGAGLLVQVRDRFESRVVEEGIVEVHGPAAGDHEDVADVLAGYEFGDVVGQLQARLRGTLGQGKASPSACVVANNR